jgi:excisionase family DNA binding protein
MMDKVLLTAEEAGQLLSLGRTKVYELMATGELESVTVGRARRVPADALSRFVRFLEKGPGRSDTPGAEWSPG